MSDLRVEAGVSTYDLRRRRARARKLRRLAVLWLAVLAVVAVSFGFAYEGSSGRVAAGVKIDGVDVGGMSNADAEALLRRRFAAVAATPLVVHAGSRTFRVRAGRLGVTPDWQAALATARERGDGFTFLRGFRRLYVRIFGVSVLLPVRAYPPALRELLDRIAKAVDVPRREAAMTLRGLDVVVVPARTGRLLDRSRAAKLILAALASFERKPLTLPLRLDMPRVSAADLAPVAARVRTAVSAPIRLSYGPSYYRLAPRQIAGMLLLPRGGSRELKLGGRGADRFFARFEKLVDRPPKDARFAVDGSHVRIVPSVDARLVDVPATAENVFAAVLSPTNRDAKIVVVSKPAELTTKKAQRMGITRLVSAYTTEYGGVPNRIHNVQLVARLLDDQLIAPGEEFSFNQATGARTSEKGFLEAPVIINGELQTGLGGGVCQVSTTVFNAAYEAGLNITARTNHALYISHYPQGRDATVNYPDVDLKFVNDTDHWLLLKTFVGDSSLTVGLYGTPVHRRVVSETAPLVETGSPAVKRIPDSTLLKGELAVDDPGSPSLATSVHRKVFDSHGKLLHDNVWYSSYRGEAKVIRFGTKPKPKPKSKPAPVIVPVYVIPTLGQQ